MQDEMSVWRTKTPAEILADVNAVLASTWDRVKAEAPKLFVFDPSLDCVREAHAKDFDWVMANDELVPRPAPPLAWPKLPERNLLVERLEANELEIRRVQPRVIRNQPRNHPIKAFRRPW